MNISGDTSRQREKTIQNGKALVQTNIFFGGGHGVEIIGSENDEKRTH